MNCTSCTPVLKGIQINLAKTGFSRVQSLLLQDYKTAVFNTEDVKKALALISKFLTAKYNCNYDYDIYMYFFFKQTQPAFPGWDEKNLFFKNI